MCRLTVKRSSTPFSDIRAIQGTQLVVEIAIKETGDSVLLAQAPVDPTMHAANIRRPEAQQVAHVHDICVRDRRDLYARVRNGVPHLEPRTLSCLAEVK